MERGEDVRLWVSPEAANRGGPDSEIRFEIPDWGSQSRILDFAIKIRATLLSRPVCRLPSTDLVESRVTPLLQAVLCLFDQAEDFACFFRIHCLVAPDGS